jgi:predicted nucleic acid-binding protein
MTRYVLDTNVVSLILRDDPVAISAFGRVSTPENHILGCPVVWYELRRGLLVRDARRQMSRLEELFATFAWQEYTRDDWSLAAALWAQRRAQGRPITDADLLIAVFARNRGAVLVTDNEKDFDTLGVAVENWLKV